MAGAHGTVGIGGANVYSRDRSQSGVTSRVRPKPCPDPDYSRFHAAHGPSDQEVLDRNTARDARRFFATSRPPRWTTQRHQRAAQVAGHRHTTCATFEIRHVPAKAVGVSRKFITCTMTDDPQNSSYDVRGTSPSARCVPRKASSASTTTLGLVLHLPPPPLAANAPLPCPATPRSKSPGSENVRPQPRPRVTFVAVRTQ